jgi:hypothetical protein
MANGLSLAERLGRGAYEPPRPGTLVPTNEAVSTVATSGWPVQRTSVRRQTKVETAFVLEGLGALSFHDWATIASSDAPVAHRAAATPLRA